MPSVSSVSSATSTTRTRASSGYTAAPSLDDVLAGRYKSKTGMGRGIIGVQRLSDKFNIQTGPLGTKVEVEVRI